MKICCFTVLVFLLTICTTTKGSKANHFGRSSDEFSDVIVPIGNHWHVLEHYKLSKLSSSKIFSLYVTKESLFRLRVEPAASVERSDKQYEIRLTIVNDFEEEIQSGLWSLRGRLRPGAHRLLLSATTSAETHSGDIIPKRVIENARLMLKRNTNLVRNSTDLREQDAYAKREDYYENTQFDSEENDDIDLEMDLYAADEKIINSCIEKYNDELPEIPFELIDKTGNLYFHPTKAFQIKTIAEEKAVKTYNFTLPNDNGAAFYFKARISGSFLNTGYLSMFLTNQHNTIFSRRGNKKNVCEIEALLQPGSYSLSVYSKGEKDEALPCTRIALELNIEKVMKEESTPNKNSDADHTAKNTNQPNIDKKKQAVKMYRENSPLLASTKRLSTVLHSDSQRNGEERRDDSSAVLSKCFSPHPVILKGVTQSSTYFLDGASHETAVHYTPTESGILRFAVVGRDDIHLSLKQGETVLLDNTETKAEHGISTIVSSLKAGERYDIVLSYNFVNAAACERVRIESAFNGEDSYLAACDSASQEETLPDLSPLASGAISSFELPQTTFYRHNKATSKSTVIFSQAVTFTKRTIVTAELLTDFLFNDMDMEIQCDETGDEVPSVHTQNRRTITKIFESGHYHFVLYGGKRDANIKPTCLSYSLSLSTKLYALTAESAPLVPTRRLFPSTLMTPDLLASHDSVIIDEDFRVPQLNIDSKSAPPQCRTELTVKKESLLVLDAKDGVGNGASFSLLEDEAEAVVINSSATASAVAYKLHPQSRYTVVTDFAGWTAVHNKVPLGHYHVYLRITPTDSDELEPASEDKCKTVSTPVRLSDGFVHYDDELHALTSAKNSFSREIHFKVLSDALLSARLEQHSPLSLYFTVLNEAGITVAHGRDTVHMPLGKGAYVLRVYESTDFSLYSGSSPSICVRARLVLDIDNPHGISATGAFCMHDFFPMTLDGLGSRFGAGLTISEQFRISAFNVPTTTEFSVENESFFRIDIQRVAVNGENVPLSFSLVSVKDDVRRAGAAKNCNMRSHETVVSQQRGRNGIAAATILAPGKYRMSITFHYGGNGSDIVIGAKDEWSVETRDPRYQDPQEILSCECFSISLALQRTELLEDANEGQCPLVHFPESAAYGTQESLTVTTPISPRGYVRELEISSETPLRIMAGVLFDVATSMVHVSIQGHARSDSVSFSLQQEAVLTPNKLSVHTDVPPGEYALVVEHMPHDPERWPSQLTCASYFLTYLVDSKSERTNCACTATLPEELFTFTQRSSFDDEKHDTQEHSIAQRKVDPAFYHGSGFLLSSETEVQKTVVNVPEERYVHVFVEAAPKTTRIAALFESLQGAPVVQPSTIHDVSFLTTGAFSLMLYADRLSEYCSYYTLAISTVTPSAFAKRTACPKQIDSLPSQIEFSKMPRELTFASAFTDEEVEEASEDTFERRVQLKFTAATYVEAKLRFDFTVDNFEMQLLDDEGTPIGSTSMSFGNEANSVISCSATVPATVPTACTLRIRTKKHGHGLSANCRNFILNIFAIDSSAPRISKILPDTLVGLAPCKRLEFDVYLTAPANSDTLDTNEFYLVPENGEKSLEPADEMEYALFPSSAVLSLSRQRVKLIFTSGTLEFGTTYRLKRSNSLRDKNDLSFFSNIEPIIVSTAKCDCGEHGTCKTVSDSRCAVCVCDLGFVGTKCAHVDMQHRVTTQQTHLILAGVLTVLAVFVALPTGASVWNKTQMKMKTPMRKIKLQKMNEAEEEAEEGFDDLDSNRSSFSLTAPEDDSSVE